MRPSFWLPVALLFAAAGCARAVAPLPTVTPPRYPEFIAPAVPVELASTPAAWHQDRAWRFLQAGDLSTAEREAAQALKVSPTFYPADAAWGWVALARSDPKTGLTHFDRALSGDAAYVSALIGRGRALVSLEREGEAIEAFEAALGADPSLADTRRQVEVLRFRSLERNLAAARQAADGGRTADARGAYLAAVAASPDSAVLYRELARLERQAGESEAAMRHFQRALELDPVDAQSKAQVAEMLETAGDLDAALQAYEESLALEPNVAVETSRDGVRARMELAKLPAEYRAIDGAVQATRGDLAALVGVRLGSLLQGTSSGDAVVITDVRGHWAESWIMVAARTAIMDPFENHTFQPTVLVRRSDLAQVVTRLLPRVAAPAALQTFQAARPIFPDLADSHLAYAAASAAVASGVLRPAASGEFEPSRPVTGGEAVAAIELLRTMAGAAR